MSDNTLFASFAFAHKDMEKKEEEEFASRTSCDVVIFLSLMGHHGFKDEL